VGSWSLIEYPSGGSSPGSVGKFDGGYARGELPSVTGDCLAQRPSGRSSEKAPYVVALVGLFIALCRLQVGKVADIDWFPRRSPFLFVSLSPTLTT
jgi:hypothetical protein